METLYQVTDYIREVMFMSIMAKIAKDMILIKFHKQV